MPALGFPPVRLPKGQRKSLQKKQRTGQNVSEERRTLLRKALFKKIQAEQNNSPNTNILLKIKSRLGKAKNRNTKIRILTTLLNEIDSQLTERKTHAADAKSQLWKNYDKIEDLQYQRQVMVKLYQDKETVLERLKPLKKFKDKARQEVF